MASTSTKPFVLPANVSPFYCYGQMHVWFTSLEAITEVAIMKLSGCEPRVNAILLAGLTFGPKADILNALMREKGCSDKQIEALRLVKESTSRNFMTHAFALGDGNLEYLHFMNRTTKPRYTVRSKRFTGMQLRDHVTQFIECLITFRNLAGVTNDEVQVYIEAIQ